MSNYKNAVCHIVVNFNNINANNGTGFFIGNGFILTCYHNLQNEDGNLKISDIKGHIYGSEFPLEFEIVDYCDKCDVALLSTTLQNNGEYPFLSLVSSGIVENQDWKLFGFPSGNTRNGETLNGTIQQITSITSEYKYDIDLLATTSIRTQYGGLSGSPILNDNHKVVGIFAYQESRVLQAVSIKKCSSFLTKNGIDVNNHSFESFSPYMKNIFDGFVDIQKPIEGFANKVMKETTPKEIIDQLGRDISYSPQYSTVEELIIYLEQHKSKNKRLWEGWLKLLTYLKALEVEIKNVSTIAVNLDIEREERTYRLGINIKLFLTDKTAYETSQDFIHNRFNKINDSNSCIVFCSESDQKERKMLNAQKCIVENISGIDPISPPKFNIGTIGLSHLSNVVIDSDNLSQVRIQLKKCFHDTIN